MQKVQTMLNKFLESKKVFWITLVLIFVIARMAVWFYPYDSDHWIFYYVGRTIANGGLLYVNAWDHKPPLIFEFNALMHLLFGGSLVLHRIFLTVLTLLDIFLFYKLANLFSKEFFKKNAEKITRIALLLYVFWRNLAQFASSGNNTENIGLIFLLLMYLAFFKWLSGTKRQTSPAMSSRAKYTLNLSSRARLRDTTERINSASGAEGSLKNNGGKGFLRSLFHSVGRNDSNGYLYLFSSGICLSILFYLKGNFLVLSLPIIVEIFLLSYKSIKKFVVNYFVFGIPFVLQTVFWVLYFNSQNALKDFWVASFAFSSAYAKSAWSGNVSPQSIFVFIMLPLLIPLAIFTINFLKDFKKIKSNMFYRFLLFGLASGLFIGFGIGSFYPYYFLISMPIFVLIFAYGLFRHPERSGTKKPALSLSNRKDPFPKPKIRESKINLRDSSTRTPRASVGMTMALLILIGGMAMSFAMSSKQLLNSFRGPVKVQLNEYQQIADYIKDNSSKNDKIVFYDYGAVMYRLAERGSGSRFISASVLLLDERDQYGFHLSDKFIDDIEKSKPKYWIISKNDDSLYYQNKKIILHMLNNFRVEKEFDNYMVLKNKRTE